MKILLVAAIAFATLSSCATVRNFTNQGHRDPFAERCQARVGQNINHIIDEIGAPSDEYKKPNGERIFTWTTVGATRGTASHWNGLSVGRSYIERCNVSYRVGDDDIVRSWAYDGNICR